MNISLTPKLEQLIQDKVNSGMYTSVSEVIRESLRLMSMHDQLKSQRVAQLNAAIEAGLESLNQGRRVDGETSYKKMKGRVKQFKKGE